MDPTADAPRAPKLRSGTLLVVVLVALGAAVVGIFWLRAALDESRGAREEERARANRLEKERDDARERAQREAERANALDRTLANTKDLSQELRRARDLIEELQSEMGRARQRLDEEGRKRLEAEGQLERAQSERDLLKERLTQATTAVGRLTSSLSSLTQTNQALQAQVASLESAAEQAREGLADSNSSRNRDAMKLDALRTKHEQLLNERKSLEAHVVKLSDDVRELKFHLGRYREKFGDLPSPKRRHMNGRVSVVRDGLVAISLGAKDGVKPGYVFTVSRGSNYVAQITITDVQEKVSIGTVDADMSSSHAPPKVGDRVTSR